MVKIYLGKTQEGPSLFRGLSNFVGRKKGGPTMREGVDALKTLIEGDMEAGKIAQHPMIEIPDDQIEDALVESLAQA